MGFVEESLESESSNAVFNSWKAKNCQPNYWLNVQPDHTKTCGPYEPSDVINPIREENYFEIVNENNHDTIGTVSVDDQLNIAGSCTTNGLIHKIPGRVADSSIPGSGTYAENTVGACAATGDGDIMMRFSPSFYCVSLMRAGASPGDAAKMAINRIFEYYPGFTGAVIAVDSKENYGAACAGMTTFPYSYRKTGMDAALVQRVSCENVKNMNKSTGIK